MRESQLMFLQYLTGLLVVVFGSFHFLLISVLSPSPDKILYAYSGTSGAHVLVGGTLFYSWVRAVYSSLIWGSVLELLLTFLVFHVFNGFRVVLSEIFPGTRADKIITYALVIVALVVFIWGSRTVVVALNGGF